MKKRIFSLIMVLAMIIGLGGVLPEGYVIKADASAKDSAYDCVAYAKARFYEYYGFSLHACGGGAAGYYTNASSYGDTVSSTPAAGTLAVWDYDANGAGSHVAFVESVNGNKVFYSEGGYVNKYNQKIYHEEERDLNNMSKSWTEKDTGIYHYQQFLGFVYVNGATEPATPEGDELTQGAGQTIPDGDYWIFSSLNQNFYVDIDGVASTAADGTNVALWSLDNNTMPLTSDVYHVKYLGNTFYSITQLNTDKCIEVCGLSKKRGANVQTWGYADELSQQWSIENWGRGYKIRSRISGYYMDVSGGTAANGTNICVWEGNETDAQFYGFVPYTGNTQPVENGNYRIKSAIDNTYYLNASGEAGSYKNGTAIRISNEDSDVFNLEYAGNGYYKIIEDSTKLNLEVANDDTPYLSNCQKAQLWAETSNRGIYWYIKQNGDGTYTLLNQLSGYPLDVAGGVAINGALCQQYMNNGTLAQKWIFEPVAEITPGDADGDGETTLVDVMLMQQYIAGWGVDINLLNCDIDSDSEVTLIDVMTTQQIIAGWEIA